MDGDTSKPLTTEQAKARLRAAAERASPGAWFERHHWRALGLAAAGGFLLSRTRLPMATGVLTSRWIVPLLLEVAIHGLSGKGSTSHATKPPQRGAR